MGLSTVNLISCQMQRDLQGRMMKLMNQGQEKENNSQFLNNNLRFNYSSQPSLTNSLNFPSRSNIIRLKDIPIPVPSYEKKKPLLMANQPSKVSVDISQKYRTAPSLESKTENDNYTEEYASDLYEYLLAKNNNYGTFLRKHEVDQGLRARMVDWMVEVLTSYKCSNRTFFKTVDIMDRYFQLESRSLPISKLHLVGVTSIYIAAKIEEVYPIKLKTVEEKIAHKKLSEKDILQKENDFLKAMSFNVLGDSVFDIACLLLCRVAASQYVREVGIRFSDKKVVQLEDTLAHIAKVIIFNYGILSSYPKSIIAGSLLLAAFTASGLLNPFLHDRVAQIVHSQDLQVCYDEVVVVLKEFSSRYPGLNNLKRFSKIDHERLISKL